MQNVNGIWLPDDERHLQRYAEGKPYGKWTYQGHKLLAALDYVKDMRVAVDIGGHCGLWSKELIKGFQAVVAFEPLERHRECFVRNVEADYILYPVALGEKNGYCNIKLVDGMSGCSHIDGEGEIPVRRLDDYELIDVDFIKVDCEGYEYFALKGGEETLLRYKPTVVVEQKPGNAQKYGLGEIDAVDYLIGLGATLNKVIDGDYILSWLDS